MADDLDELLDEVESQLLSGNNSKNRTGKVKLKTKNAFSHISLLSNTDMTKSEELEAAIEDICNMPEPPKGEVKVADSITGIINLKKRCHPVYLGGSSTQMGFSSKLSQRACNNIRCVACDFKISAFNDFVWDETTDYIFLRNNMPEYEKLRAKLQVKKGWRAYSCQCERCSVDSLTEIQKVITHKWVCGQH